MIPFKIWMLLRLVIFKLYIQFFFFVFFVRRSLNADNVKRDSHDCDICLKEKKKKTEQKAGIIVCRSATLT